MFLVLERHYLRFLLIMRLQAIFARFSDLTLNLSEIQDQNVCMHYSRYGICKFGPACKFDHPINPPPSAMPGLDQQSSYTNSASVDVVGSGGANGATIQ